MTIKTLVVGRMATNCYIVDGIIIDPGDDAEYVMSHCTTKPTMIVATHGHFDHIMAAYALQRTYNIPFYIHKDDIFLLSNMQSSAKHFLGLNDVDPPPTPSPIRNLSFIHTPGHTPGSICLPVGDVLFTGDTIFANGAVGRTDHEYSDKTALSRSIKTILSLPSETRLLSGHGEASRVKYERPYHAVVQ
jgi:glyoxylase-like metal-dependent hydrolase (beta-lactamase superfamily II)